MVTSGLTESNKIFPSMTLPLSARPDKANLCDLCLSTCIDINSLVKVIFICGFFAYDIVDGEAVIKRCC